MDKSDIQEALASLYFRLNGYFTTSLLVHSPPSQGRLRTEVDCLAIRHPFHAQPERVHPTAELLGESGMADLIICEVKTSPSRLRFNKAVRTNPEALHSLLRWAGVLSEEDLRKVVPQLLPLLQHGVSKEDARTGVIVENSRVRLRAILCCPELDQPGTDRWCLTGVELLSYANGCFNPETPRASCNVSYDFLQWGQPFAPIVQWFKQKPAALTMKALYAHLGVA